MLSKRVIVCLDVRDGKTTKVCNLANSFAMEGKSVLVIDADLRRSNVHKVYEMERGIGLSEYLTEQATFDEVIQPVSQEKVFVITAGERPPNPTEILGSGRFRALLDEGLRKFDLAIIDSPAVVPVACNASCQSIKHRHRHR